MTMLSNYHQQYLIALKALITELGGDIPTGPFSNFLEANYAHLDALVDAVGGTVPTTGDETLKRWAAAITALEGDVPTYWTNPLEALLLHVEAFQEARGGTVPFRLLAPTNFQENLLQILTLEV
jgi:hypothetical protein